MSIIAINSTAIAPTTNPLLTAMIGGTVAFPTYPLTPIQINTGMTQNFVADYAARYFYWVDTSHNLWRWDSSNPTTAAVQLLTAASIGHTINGMTMALDNSKIYAITSDYYVISILTASPYTVAIIAGNGATGTADGTGTAASFGTLIAITIEPNLGQQLIVQESSSGKIRSVTTAGVVVSLSGGLGAGGSTSMGYDKAGNVYFSAANNLLSAAKPVVGSLVGDTLLETYSSAYVAPLTVDDAQPSGVNLYYFVSNLGAGKQLIRYNVPTATTAVIATTTNQVATTAGAGYVPNNICFRHPAIYMVDLSGNLLSVQG